MEIQMNVTSAGDLLTDSTRGWGWGKDTILWNPVSVNTDTEGAINKCPYWRCVRIKRVDFEKTVTTRDKENYLLNNEVSVLIKRVFDCGGLPFFLARSFRSSAVKLSKRKKGKKRENVYGQVILPYTLNYSGTVAPWARGKTPNRKKQYQAQQEKNNMFTRTLDVIRLSLSEFHWCDS